MRHVGSILIQYPVRSAKWQKCLLFPQVWTGGLWLLRALLLALLLQFIYSCLAAERRTVRAKEQTSNPEIIPGREYDEVD